jgi:hypothetical protein
VHSKKGYGREEPDLARGSPGVRGGSAVYTRAACSFLRAVTAVKAQPRRANYDWLMEGRRHPVSRSRPPRSRQAEAQRSLDALVPVATGTARY